MRRSKRPIVIGSRKSPLAKAQAEMVGRALDRLHPWVEVQYNWIESAGDRHDAAMAGAATGAAGAKGQFTAAIDRAVLDGEADLAVHSLKDLPAEPTKGLTLAAVPRRAEVRDCLITPTGAVSLGDLPEGGIFGTSSPRRAAQVRCRRPDLHIRPVRGNVQTRLAKVLEGEGAERYDATLLAMAGLVRCGLGEHTGCPVPSEMILPAASQGALGLHCRGDDHLTLTRCLPLNDPEAASAVHAERQVVAALGADCHSPVAVLARPCEPPAGARRNEGQWFHVRAKVLSPDGAACAAAEDQASTKRLRHRVRALIETLHEQGADRILAQARENPMPTSEPPA